MRTTVILLTLGAVTVLQATLNRRIGAELGLAQAVLLNALVMCACATVAVLAFAGGPHLPSGSSESWRSWSWWWVLPGGFGFAIVLGLPLMVERVGALATFVLVVVAQALAGLAWDAIEEGIPLSPTRVLGVVCAVAAVFLVGRRA